MRFYFLTKYKYSLKVGKDDFVTVNVDIVFLIFNVDIVFLIFIVLSGSLIFQSTESAFFAGGQYAFPTIIWLHNLIQLFRYSGIYPIILAQIRKKLLEH